MADRPERALLSSSDRLGDRAPEWDRYWAEMSPERKVMEIFELRRIYHETLYPGIGVSRMDRSVGGVRRLWDEPLIDEIGTEPSPASELS